LYQAVLVTKKDCDCEFCSRRTSRGPRREACGASSPSPAPLAAPPRPPPPPRSRRRCARSGALSCCRRLSGRGEARRGEERRGEEIGRLTLTETSAVHAALPYVTPLEERRGHAAARHEIVTRSSRDRHERSRRIALHYIASHYMTCHGMTLLTARARGRAAARQGHVAAAAAAAARVVRVTAAARERVGAAVRHAAAAARRLLRLRILPLRLYDVPWRIMISSDVSSYPNAVARSLRRGCAARGANARRGAHRNECNGHTRRADAKRREAASRFRSVPFHSVSVAPHL